MKQSVKKILDALYEEETAEVEVENEVEVEANEEDEYSYDRAWHEEMKRLVVAGLAGDTEAWGIWSDMWKDEHGVRPRYSIDRIKWMYGLE